MARLTDKVVLITGAGGGQGAAEARLFASEGAALLLTGLPDDGTETVAQELKQQGANVTYCPHDVSDEAQWIEAIALAQKTFGKLHVLVNNAGTIGRQGIADATLAVWQRTINVNLTGPMLGMKHAAPLIRDSGGGSIINISSTAGMSAHYDAAYGASKWGLRGLTKTAAIEFVDWKIRVNSIHPGQIADTSFMRDGKVGHAEAGRQSTPMQRQGTPQECAQLVLFLASDESSYITGSEIAIDGGYTAGAAIWMRSRMQAAMKAAQDA